MNFPEQKFQIGDKVVRTSGGAQMSIVGVDYVIFYQTLVPNKWGTEDVCDWTEEELQPAEPTGLSVEETEALLGRMVAAWGRVFNDKPIKSDPSDCNHEAPEGLCYCEVHNDNGFLHDNCPKCGMKFGVRHLMEQRAEMREAIEPQVEHSDICASDTSDTLPEYECNSDFHDAPAEVMNRIEIFFCAKCGEKL